MKNILIINLARLGDIVQSIPMVEALKLKYPGCRVTLLVNSRFTGSCSLIPGIYETIGLDFREAHTRISSNSNSIEDGYKYIKKMFDRLRESRFDKIINITPHDIGVLATFLSGEDKVFWTNVNDWLKYYFIITKEWKILTLNVVDLFKRIAGVSRYKTKNRIAVKESAAMFARNLLRGQGKTKDRLFIGLQTGASTLDKIWPIEFYTDLALKIKENLNADIVLFGSKEDLRDGALIENRLDSGVLNMIGKTDIHQLSALMSEIDILVTNDTGPMHIAALAGTKIISLTMGKELCETTGPYGEGNISLQPSISCYPCSYTDACLHKKCRTMIKPDAVFNVIKYLTRSSGTIHKEEVGEDIQIYVSRFDNYGTLDYLPFFKKSLDHRTFYRKILRKVFDLTLSDEFDDVKPASAAEELGCVFDNYFHTVDFFMNTEDVLNKKQSILGINDLSARGVSISKQIFKLAANINCNINYIKAFSKELEEIDIQIKAAGEGLKELKPIVVLFQFEIESLKGKNIFELSEETGLIYKRLIQRGRIVLSIMDYFIETKSKTFINKRIA